MVYVILGYFGEGGYITYTLLYPVALDTASARLGYFLFKRGDLF
jgi:hypothetical protein